MIDPIKHYRVLLKQNLKHLGLQINSQNHRHNSKFTLQKLVNKQTTRPIKSKIQLNKNGNKPTHKYTNSLLQKQSIINRNGKQFGKIYIQQTAVLSRRAFYNEDKWHNRWWFQMILCSVLRDVPAQACTRKLQAYTRILVRVHAYSYIARCIVPSSDSLMALKTTWGKLAVINLLPGWWLHRTSAYSAPNRWRVVW